MLTEGGSQLIARFHHGRLKKVMDVLCINRMCHPAYVETQELMPLSSVLVDSRVRKQKQPVSYDSASKIQIAQGV